jgi:hypothetical protein
LNGEQDDDDDDDHLCLQDVPKLSPIYSSRRPAQLLLLNYASKLTRLTNLSSLSTIQQKLNQQDWEAIVKFGSRLTVRSRGVKGLVALCEFGMCSPACR